VYHLFVTCIFCKDVWTRTKKELNLLTVWDGSTLDDCFENWDRKEDLYITLPSILCWFVWLARNKTIFEGSNPSPLSVVYKLRENLTSRPLSLKKTNTRIV
jgi:hypothetical protein